MTPEWIQTGELGLAFVVIILMAGLVTYIVKSSTDREKEYLSIITGILPLLQGISTSVTSAGVSVGAINLRIDEIGHSLIEMNINLDTIAVIQAKLGEIDQILREKKEQNVKVD